MFSAVVRGEECLRLASNGLRCGLCSARMCVRKGVLLVLVERCFLLVWVYFTVLC